MKYLKFKKILFISMLFLVLFSGGFIFFTYLKYKNNNFVFENENILVEKDNYKIRISYPKFNSFRFTKKIESIINKEKKAFLKEIKKLEDSNKIYELNINYDCTNFDNIYSIHFRIFTYLGGAHYERDDTIYYYDSNSNKEISLSEIFNDDIYIFLEAQARSYFLDNSDKYKLFDDEMFDDGIMGKKENYNIISFEKDYMYVIFTPYQIAPWSTGEIKVPISYPDVKEYLNSKYFSINKISNIPYDDVDSEFENEGNKNIIQEENVSVIRDESFFKDKKLIAFTFDDGPTWNLTNDFLDELDKRNAKVSFFILGQRASTQQKLTKKIFDKGHTLGSHTFDHKNLLNLSLEEARYEITHTNEILKDITGNEPKYLRPPYGNYNKALLDSTDMTFILWNVDTQDWKLRNASKIAEYILANVEDGSIVLLHDLYKESIEGVLQAMDKLESQGYAFVSIDEMANLKNVNLKSHQVYRYIK